MYSESLKVAGPRPFLSAICNQVVFCDVAANVGRGVANLARDCFGGHAAFELFQAYTKLLLSPPSSAAVLIIKI